MPIEQLQKILISGGLGCAIAGADLLGLFLTVKFFCAGKTGTKNFVVYFVSEIVRLTLVLGILFGLAFIRTISFGWLVVCPILFSLFKFGYAFYKIKKL
jgi:hypothetical protein